MRPLSSPERALSVANLTKAVDEIKRWATEQGLRGATARDLFEGYCRRLEAHGFTLMRAYVSTRTLHPQWTGYGYTWRRELRSVREQQFARGPISQEWLSSPFNALIQRSASGIPPGRRPCASHRAERLPSRASASTESRNQRAAVDLRRKNPCRPGHLSVEINREGSRTR
jgi:hypothetical protein